MRLTIPVQVDSVKISADSQGARCIYYRVEVAEGYVLRKTRFLLSSRAYFAAGVSWAALAGPEGAVSEADLLFLTPELITKTMDSIHANAKLFLELGYIWVPTAVVEPGFPGEPIREGDIYRLSMPYFLHCYRFVNGKISEDEFLHPQKRFIQPVKPSPQETLAFRKWRQEQIEISRQRYHQPEYAGFRLAKKQEDL